MRRIKNLILKRRIKRTIFLLNKIDATMRAMSMPKWKRKQVWRDFIKAMLEHDLDSFQKNKE